MSEAWHDPWHDKPLSDSTSTCQECDPLDNKCPVYRGAASDCPDPCEEGGTDE